MIFVTDPNEDSMPNEPSRILNRPEGYEVPDER